LKILANVRTDQKDTQDRNRNKNMFALYIHEYVTQNCREVWNWWSDQCKWCRYWYSNESFSYLSSTYHL